jgi:threonine dehydratase
MQGKLGAGPIVCVVSGGNIDLAKFAALIGACDQ